MSDTLAKEMLDAVITIERAAQELRCYSVIQPMVSVLRDHISAIAGNISKNVRIVELEAEVARLTRRINGGDIAQHLSELEDEIATAHIAKKTAVLAERQRWSARIAELEAVLKPFAVLADRYDPDEGDDDYFI